MAEVTTQVDWDKAKAYYLSDPSIGHQDVANAFGISRQRVGQVAVAKGWQELKEKVRNMTSEELDRNLAVTIAEAKSRMAMTALKAMNVVDTSLDTLKPIKAKSMLDVSAAVGALQTASKIYLTAVGEEVDPVKPVVILVKTIDGQALDISRIG